MLPYDPNGVAVPHIFIGDESFPLQKDLLWSFPRNQLSNETKYTTTGYVEGEELRRMFLAYLNKGGVSITIESI